jgi:hypothetical protein
VESQPLFDAQTLGPVEQVVLELDGPSLRCVFWKEEAERVCLVRCDGGERNVRRIRKLATLCGTSCEDVTRTSSIPPARLPYCVTCLAESGHGVLR